MVTRLDRSCVLLVFVALMGTAGACGLRGPYFVPPLQVEGAPDVAVDHRVLLIGDAGDPHPDGEPVLHVLTTEARRLPARTTVVFLGDNVYETGMPEASALEGTAVEEILDEALVNLYESRRDAERRLKQQVLVLRTSRARGIFVPGNHDWDQFGIGGWERVLEQERYLDTLASDGVDVDMLPGGGCPGPSAADLARQGRLIVLDTQWWLDAGRRPGPTDNPTGCTTLTEDAVVAGLERALGDAAADRRWAIVVGHHPLRSEGPHGGRIDPRWHAFPLLMLDSYVPIWLRWVPLPGIGTVMGLVRRCCSPSAQDFAGKANRHFRARIEDALTAARDAGAAPVLYAAGHEHSLQLFRNSRGARHLLVSGRGSGSKASPVGRDDTTLFAHADPERPGFARLDLLRDGRVRLALIEVVPGTDEGEEVFSRWLHPPAAEGS
jgi:predicted small lipoprotein YifL